MDRLTTLERSPARAPNKSDGLLPLPAHEVRLNRHAGFPIPPPKWELPSFEGKEPNVWLRMCERYFSLYKTIDNLKVEAVALYLNGLAEVWYNSLTLSK